MAIKATELRIGNWVCSRSTGRPAQIRLLHDYPEVLHDPIPLTPDILEKAGFDYARIDGITTFDEGSRDGYTSVWEKSIKANDYNEGMDFCLIKWGNDSDYFTFSYQLLRVRIKYLHQLQNLFHALTGEELTIDL